MREEFYYYIRHFTSRFSIFIKWLVFSLLSGVLIGGAGTVFHYCMVWANDTRLTYPFIAPCRTFDRLGIPYAARRKRYWHQPGIGGDPFWQAYPYENGALNFYLHYHNPSLWRVCRTGRGSATAWWKHWKYFGKTVSI